MEKKVRIQKSKITRVLLILFSIVVVLISVWLGFSYFSMRSDRPYVFMLMDVENELLASKVRRDFPTIDGKYYRYSFPIILEEYSVLNDGIEIIGIPYNYKNYYASRDEARFKYVLEKNKGDFDFNKLEWNHPLIVTLQYRLDEDFKKFTEFSMCTLKTTYSRIFGIKNECGTGNCYIKRDINKWEIEVMNKNIAEKATFFNSFDIDLLKKSLINYYITDDSGLFTPDRFKIVSKQTSMADGSYQFNSEFISNSPENVNGSLIPWALGGISYLYKQNYEEYLEVDLFEYMQTINALYPESIERVYLDCQMAYEVITNIESCNSTECKELKQASFQNCKKSLDYQLSNYSEYNTTFKEYELRNSGNAFLFYLPSEMIYFNKIVEKIGLNEDLYNKSTVSSYFVNAQSLNQMNPSTIGSCHLLKDTEEIFSYFSDSFYSIKAQEIYSSIPNLVDLCDVVVKDKYCTLELSQKMVCADAMSYSYPDSSSEILHDLFYRHYNLSPIAAKMPSYETLRDFLNDLDTKVQGIRLDDYSYFVQRKEYIDGGEVSISTSANMMDSYYFIYLLNRIEDAK